MDTDEAMDDADAPSTPPPSCIKNAKRRLKTTTTTA